MFFSYLYIEQNICKSNICFFLYTHYIAEEALILMFKVKHFLLTGWDTGL